MGLATFVFFLKAKMTLVSQEGSEVINYRFWVCMLIGKNRTQLMSWSVFLLPQGSLGGLPILMHTNLLSLELTWKWKTTCL